MARFYLNGQPCNFPLSPLEATCNQVGSLMRGKADCMLSSIPPITIFHLMPTRVPCKRASNQGKRVACTLRKGASAGMRTFQLTCDAWAVQQAHVQHLTCGVDHA